MMFNGASALLVAGVDFALAGTVLALSTFVTMWVGILSFGTVCFAAVGGYVAAQVLSSGFPNPVVALLSGAVGGGILAALVSPALIRLKSHWLALATVALILVVRVFAQNLTSLTGGSAGTVVNPGISGWLAFGTVIVLAIALDFLRRSPVGMAADLAREDQTVAETLGVNVRSVQIAAFVASGLIGGAGGVLEAGFLGYISPDTFYIDLAVVVLASVVLGGAYHWAGAIVGAIIFAGMPVFLNQVAGSIPGLIEGVLLLAVMLALPGGLIDPARRARKRASHRNSKSTVIEHE